LVAGGSSVQIGYSMSLSHSDPMPRPRAAHIWPQEAAGFYIEPQWCSERLFVVERFVGSIWDCCCGTGRIAETARSAGYHVIATDLVDRGYQHFNGRVDFLACVHLCGANIVANPPFDLCQQFVEHALNLDLPVTKIAVIWQVPRLNAAHRWLTATPLARVYLLTPDQACHPAGLFSTVRSPAAAGRTFVGWCLNAIISGRRSYAGYTATGATYEWGHTTAFQIVKQLIDGQKTAAGQVSGN
jgi:hypothetical protein